MFGVLFILFIFFTQLNSFTARHTPYRRAYTQLLMNEPTETIAEAVQDAQDQLEAVQDTLPEEHQAQQEAVEDALEDAEDAIDEMEDAREAGDDEAFSDALGHATAAVQTAQDELDILQDGVGYEDADQAELIESAEDTIEVVEDELHTINDDDVDGELIVVVNEEEKDAPERFMTPLEIVRLFDYDPDNVVLYKARDIQDGSQEGDQFLPRDEDIDLRDLNRFACLPSETPYGATADDQTDEIENDALRQDIERLREEYAVDVQDDAKGNFTQVIVRDWPIPSDAYNKDRTDVMIRVPQGYPQQHPDWVYVEEDLKLASGGWPKKHNRDRVPGWLALSWHINKLEHVSWVPYETDLKWYLDTFCDHRLRQGT
jgi:hypothetical protein